MIGTRIEMRASVKPSERPRSGRTPSGRRIKRGAESRDREVTRAAILAAAEQEFARHGMEGARTEEIAGRSGVTKGMIYHYFGSKEKLYEAALENVFAPLLMSLQPFAAPGVDPEKALEGVIRRILELSAQRPGAPAMLYFEAIQNRGAYYDKIGFPSLYHVLATILESGSRRGAFRHLDPWHTAVNIVGACGFYYCLAPRLQPLWPGNPKALSPGMMRAHGDEVLNLVMRGVRA
jgi:TetR/AcrR family transcriptional regulator